jgi:hypothetical protein
VCGTEDTVNCSLVGLEFGTELLVKVSVSVWKRGYGKLWSGGTVGWYRSVGEG